MIDIVSLAHNVSFWAQKLSQILFKWSFLVSIELIYNTEHVQIVFSFSIAQNSGKKYWDQKLAKCVSFWAQKLTHNVSFWGQK